MREVSLSVANMLLSLKIHEGRLKMTSTKSPTPLIYKGKGMKRGNMPSKTLVGPGCHLGHDTWRSETRDFLNLQCLLTPKGLSVS